MLIGLIKLILVIPFILILPGFFFQIAIFGWKSSSGGEKISFFERAVLTVPLSLIIVDLIVLLLSKLNIILSGPVLIGSVIIFFFLCVAVFQIRFGKKKKEENHEKETASENLFQFTVWQTIFILLALVLAVFIRAAYLSDTIIPSATDMGHHMYWVQTIIDSGRLPNYGMPDFIIGEHIIFAAINLISGIGLMTAMPALLLLFFNIIGIFAMAILVGRVLKSDKIVAVSFFIVGSLYAINPPQGRYVSGGVVGNIIGNLLIPVALYFLYRAFSERSEVFAGLFLFSFAGLLYTHHLSALVFIFSVVGILILYLALNIKDIFNIAGNWLKVFLNPFSLAVLVFVVYFLLFISIPSYFNAEAVSQATGAPTKITRVGLSLSQIEGSVGSAQLVLGGLGFLLALFAFKKRKLEYSVMAGWFLILFLMAWKPGWLYINIPSSRVVNYMYLPLVLLSSYALVVYFENFRVVASRFLAAVLLFTLLFFVITNGLSDSANVFKARSQFQETMETFHSAEYLAAKINTDKDIILKDHVNIYADSWYKLFFMKDYKYPLSRGNLSRYIDPTKPRETCTRDMITEPQSETGKSCFRETGVNYIVLNAEREGDSFEEYPEFSKVYGSDYISIFRRD